MALIQLMIADDHILLREGLKNLLESESDFQIVAEAGDGTECLNKLVTYAPDLLILNMDMPKKNGLEVLNELNQRGKRKTKILIITGCKDMIYFSKAYHLGIEGYLFKDSSYEELKKAIHSIIAGEIYLSSELLPLLDKIPSIYEDNDKRIENLTKRELEILKNLTIGMYNKEIATKLGISERTVKNHVSNIFKKISVADRTQAAVFAIKNHIVRL